ncbi:CysS/YqeB C-terminal domain-containing protein [Leptothoe spongobia]|uniref:CysS/YqeB C-terminal domain-containing protein n=1 Tax=Leptothoe spongobia TaxID=2651728 RepID=UPI001FEB1724|nr:hypothetical protein [Leptothoe spongobia]
MANVSRIRKFYAQVLGLETEVESDTDAAIGELDEGAIADLIQQRQTARQQRDFITADDIREQLAAVGVRWLINQMEPSVGIGSKSVR